MFLTFLMFDNLIVFHAMRLCVYVSLTPQTILLWIYIFFLQSVSSRTCEIWVLSYFASSFSISDSCTICFGCFQLLAHCKLWQILYCFPLKHVHSAHEVCACVSSCNHSAQKAASQLYDDLLEPSPCPLWFLSFLMKGSFTDPRNISGRILGEDEVNAQNSQVLLQCSSFEKNCSCVSLLVIQLV